MLNLNIIQDIMDVDSIGEIQKILLKNLHHFDIEYFNYGIQLPSIYKRETPYIISGYDKKWIDHYVKEKYHEIDATVLYSFQNIAPVTWTDDHFNTCKKMREESKDAGLVHGVTYPIRGTSGEKGLFCISSKNAVSTEASLYMNAMVPFIHNKIFELDLHKNIYFDIPNLTKKEEEFLKWMAVGKSNEDIAMIMGITYRTCVDYTNKLVKKFNCQNKSQVICLAIMKGIIQL